MACHPSGVTVDIVGILADNHGRSCEKHKVCGCVAAPDVVVRFRAVELEKNPGQEGTVVGIAVYHVTGGVDGCRIGFLRHHLTRYKDEYDGRLAQIVEVFDENSESPSDRAKHHRNRGCCRAVLIEAEYREPPTKKQRTEQTNEESNKE